MLDSAVISTVKPTVRSFYYFLFKNIKLLTQLPLFFQLPDVPWPEIFQSLVDSFKVLTQEYPSCAALAEIVSSELCLCSATLLSKFSDEGKKRFYSLKLSCKALFLQPPSHVSIPQKSEWHDGLSCLL